MREEYEFSAAHAKRRIKVSLIGPDRILQRFAREQSQHVHRDVDAFTADVVAIERGMIRGLVDAGCCSNTTASAVATAVAESQRP